MINYLKDFIPDDFGKQCIEHGLPLLLFTAMTIPVAFIVAIPPGLVFNAAIQHIESN